MLNFNNLGVKPITNAAGNLTLPVYSSGSVPRGMWHQFGAIEPDENKGIFLEIGDIPRNWLRFHYDVRSNNSIYNRNNASTYGKGTAASMKPLTDIIKFSKDNTSKRLGEIKESTTIKEAVVAVPYINDVDCADPEFCPVCGEEIVFDRDLGDLCDRCGWADWEEKENLDKTISEIERYG